MSRSMKIGVATIVAAFLVSLMATDDAEARNRRFGRHRRGGGGCHGYSACCGVQAPVSCCGVAAAPVACPTGACGVACPGGVCNVGGAYSGGYSAGYGTAPGYGYSVQGQNHSTMPPSPNGAYGQGTPTPAINGGNTFRQNGQQLNGGTANGATRSPSDRLDDRPPAPPGAGNNEAGNGAPRNDATGSDPAAADRSNSGANEARPESDPAAPPPPPQDR